MTQPVPPQPEEVVADDLADLDDIPPGDDAPGEDPPAGEPTAGG